MADKTENILVDFDYNNIIIVDPNKVLGDDGKGKERYVSQENLVMYANLECKVLPRTKLAAGVSGSDRVQNLSIASINFVKPGGKEFLDNSYTDEITGQNSLQGQGVNQPKQDSIKNPNKSDDYYLKASTVSNGENKATDNGLLGITNINIRQGLDFMPTFNVTLVDVKGRALFEAGNNSPYAAFFNMPYPLFELTVKGYYGKAIKYKLMLRSFNARYDSNSSNFVIDLVFHTYQFSSIAEVSMGYLLAVPHMYTSRISVKTTTGGPSNLNNVEDVTVTKGFQKVKEVYTEYKTKGLIPDNFPEISIVQLKNNIENFVKNILDSFSKQNLDALTNVDLYQKNLNEFKSEVFLSLTSWLDTYMDKVNFLIIDNPNDGSLTSLVTEASMASSTGNVVKNDDLQKLGQNSNGNQSKTIKVYTFKAEVKTPSERNNAIIKLEAIIKEKRKILTENKTLGLSGKYTIDGKTTDSSIPFDIKDDIFKIMFSDKQLNLEETYRQVKGVSTKPTNAELEKFNVELIEKKYLNNQTIVIKNGNTEQKFDWFYFEGKNSFNDKIEKIATDVKKWREKIQEELTEALAKLLQSSDNGIGFVPSIRNVLAVIFANGEGFLRLMDDVHTTAWDERLNPLRQKPIFNKTISNASPDNISSGVNELLPVYPWPTYMVATSGEDGHEKFELKYPGDKEVIGDTNGHMLNVWPEIEFVEEFLKGFTARAVEPKLAMPKFNEVTDVKRITLNALEFPISNTVYQNKEEVKFFYELFERIALITNYSRLNRVNDFKQDADNTANLIAESELKNILESLSDENPFLIKKLKEYSLNSQNFVNVLEHISNQGVGVSWQNYIRGINNTPYINQLTLTDNFLFLSPEVLSNSMSQTMISLSKEKEFTEYLKTSTNNNNFDILDIYPFIDTDWCKSGLSDTTTISNSKDAFNTTKSLSFDQTLKVITNFSDEVSRLPITNFVYLDNIITPTPEDSPTLKDFYSSRKPEKQLITEGDLSYYNYSGYVSSNQTISMLNTPYFVNAIQEGIINFRNNDKHPFVSAGYLFLNSLPLSTLREKYKKYDNGVSLDLDYIFASLKKFGALHNLPYSWIVKLGSVWHRYKTYVNTNVDILDGVWKDFDYIGNYDPITSASTKDYTLTVNGGSIDIILEKNSTFGTDTSTLINTGFYPKLINDFNVFYQGFEPFSAYTNTALQSGIDNYGVALKYVDDTSIIGIKTFDPNNPTRDLSIIPWSVYINSMDGNSSFPMPSMGSVINQTRDECFQYEDLRIEVTGNTSMYNGSIRTFWAAPTYGYFNSGKVMKPNPTQYLKEILTGTTQPNFSIKGNLTKYSEISEIFSVFETNILDMFETKFLDFCKSQYDIDENVDSGANFQKLMISMMKIPKQTGDTPTKIVENIQREQMGTINSNLQLFLTSKMIIKYGNPSNFDKKLFYTFSNYSLTDSYTWEKYVSVTPNALPFFGGGITLSSSKANYPNEWKALQTYVGYSEILPLMYGNNGSYITDFFLDFNVAFTEDNIKTFSPIIKVYASQKLKETLSNTSLPTTTPNKNSTAILQNGNKIEIFLGPGPKKTAVLFDSNNLFIDSIPSAFQEDDLILFNQLIVSHYGPLGIQENPIVTKNIRSKKLIKQPVPKSNFNEINFRVLMDDYIISSSSFLDKSLNNLMLRLQVSLPDVNNTPQKIVETVLDSSQGKLDHWSSFKSLNDKWIAGTDISNKTLFEDVLLLDRASRNIGDKIIVDIYKLKANLESLFSDGAKGDMQSFVQTILAENNFVVMNLPAYVNFYNVQDAVKNANPRPEGTLDFANTLFGTFMNVDTRDSSAKMVCFYGGKGSEQLDIKNVDFKFRDDAFDIRKSSDNPLLENQMGKKDWDKSNKVVGFNVDIGPQNQSIFYGFNVGQQNGKPTAESLEVENMMANQSNGKSSATQNISLFNIYKNRSYTCTVSMMGNALIQPTMYFNLRHVPMFQGPYMITSVNHTIAPGVFETIVEGIRQPTASLPKLGNFIQSLKTNLLASIVEKNKQKTDEDAKTNANSVGGTVQNQTANAVASTSNNKKIESSNSCSDLLVEKYKKYTPVESPQEHSVNPKNLVTKIMSRMTNANVTDDGKLKYVVFASIILSSMGTDVYKSYENNFTGVDLSRDWGIINSFEKTYYCMRSGDSTLLPYAVFGSIDKNIDMLISRYKSRMSTVKPDTDGKLATPISEFWFNNRLPDNANIEKVEWSKMSETDKTNIVNEVSASISLFNTIS